MTMHRPSADSLDSDALRAAPALAPTTFAPSPAALRAPWTPAPVADRAPAREDRARDADRVRAPLVATAVGGWAAAVALVGGLVLRS